MAGTQSFGLHYAYNEEFNLVGYSDSDWVGCNDDRKSTSGSIFKLGESIITWESKKQKSVVLSSTEVEYVAATNSACQAIWLKRLLNDLGISP